MPILTQAIQDIDEMLGVVVAEAVRAGLLQAGDTVVITAGTPIGTTGTTNLIKAATI